MKKICNIFGILCFIISRKVEMQQKHAKRFVQCVEKVLWLIECQKWFAKFCVGDFFLDDAPRSVRPVEVNSDQIKTLIENNPHYTVQEIADILKISKSMNLLVKMKNVSFILWKKPRGLFGQPNIHVSVGKVMVP